MDIFRYGAEFGPGRVIKEPYFHVTQISQRFNQFQLHRGKLVEFADIAFLPGHRTSLLQSFYRQLVTAGQVGNLLLPELVHKSR